MSNYRALENASIYNLDAIRSEKRRKAKARKKARKKEKQKVIQGYKAELIERKTSAEASFEQFLDGIGIDYEFQKIIAAGGQNYIVDFYLTDYHTVIEIDGGYHNTAEQRQKDATRTARLLQKGTVANIVRFSNEDVVSDKIKSLFIQRVFPFMA